VGNTKELVKAVARARSGDTILVDDGIYHLSRPIVLRTPGVTLRGRSGDRDRVVLRGQGLTELDVGVAVAIGASDVTVADLTIGWVRFHAIQVRGEAAPQRVVIHNVRLADTGQQLLKGSTAHDARRAVDGLIACSLFEYSDAAPSDYTNGIDMLAADRWTVRDNVIRRVRGPVPSRSAGPAILFWAGSRQIVIERNLVLDSFRGIAAGLKPQSYGPDVEDCSIRNNVVVNLEPWADEGIEANAARDVRIHHNTVLVEGTLPWSVSVRYPDTAATVQNNLISRRIAGRNGATLSEAGNVDGAQRTWFVDAAGGDFHLGPGAPMFEGRDPIAEVPTEFDGRVRSADHGITAGAFERAR
jgi:hypothetical protein